MNHVCGAGACSTPGCRLLHVPLEPSDAELLRDYYDDLQQRRTLKIAHDTEAAAAASVRT